ncbi:MAG: hypothetical protein KDA38_04065 [Planctomycetales bacterium]|nr:hypothetical protein [Planctomycetales bacterium]
MMLNQRHFWICAFCLASAAATPPAFARLWNLSSGETVEGEFADLHDGAAVLIQAGRELTIPLSELSADDRTILREQVRRKRIADARQVRTWTDQQGRTIRASLRQYDRVQVILLKDGRKVPVPLVTLSAGDREYVQGLAAQEKADALAFAAAERGPLTSWSDFNFGPRVWKIEANDRKPEHELEATLVAIQRDEILYTTTSGAAGRQAKQDLSIDDLLYLAAYREAKRLRKEDIGGRPDLRRWSISGASGEKYLQARLDRIEGDAVVLQSPEDDLRVPFLSLPDADKQFVREELARRGSELPAGWEPVEAVAEAPPGRELREWHVKHLEPFQAWVHQLTPDRVELRSKPTDVGGWNVELAQLSSDDLEYLRNKFPAESRLNEQLCPHCGKGLPTYVYSGEYGNACPHCQQWVGEPLPDKTPERPDSLTRADVQRILQEARNEADQQRADAEAARDVEEFRMSSRSYRGLFKLAVFLVIAVLSGVGAVITFVVRAVSGHGRRR